MLTQCPGCQTVFRVTSTILRAAHGQVRCGNCNTQFDAIEQLQDGEDPQVLDGNETVSNSIEPTPDASGLGYAETALTHEDIILEGNRIEISGIYRRSDEAETDDNPAHSHTIIEEFNIGTEEWENPFESFEQSADQAEAAGEDTAETVMEDVEQELTAASLADAIASLEHPELSKPAVNDDEQQPTPDSSNDVASIIATNLAPEAASRSDATSEATSATARSQTLPSALADSMLFGAPFDMPFDGPVVAPSQPRRGLWLAATAVLTVLLITQALHHSRETLARHPSFGPPLTRLYAAIGQPLAPQWQLQAYSIKQWGIVSAPQEPGTLRVRASVTNGASFAQPYPLLQLSLEDRFGGKVGTRAFNPEEYLGNSAQATRLLAAGEAANVDLAIIDPGQEAVGFQFDTCLQLNGRLQCSHQLQQP